MGLFYKISLVILIGATLTYIVSTNLSDEQYSAQDDMIEYQTMVLYQMLAQKWNPLIVDNIKQDSLHQVIQDDLNRLKLSAFIGIYADNQNSGKIGELDLDQFEDINQNGVYDEQDIYIDAADTLTVLWAYKQNKADFYGPSPDYEGVGDKLQIIQNLQLELGAHPYDSLYASYGFYGPEVQPASFLEFPIQDNQILAYWLIMDYPLPADTDWPITILIIAIIIILSLVFWIISSFLYPIQLMVSHVSTLKKGALDKKLEVSASDELGVLATSINQMTADINLLINQKDELLLDVSHELKTPLTRLKFILANMNIDDANKIQLNKEINALKDMISNMLLSDKLSTPYIEDLNKEHVRVKHIVEETCAMFYKIEEKLTVEMNVVAQTVFVDKYRICLALKNLIDNALKYTDSTKLVQLIISEDDEFIYCSVQDFGRGIPKEQIQKIIKPLYRGRAAKEKSKGGFGLGLAIAKKIIEAHDGKLTIQSTLGEGSNFTLLIPKEKHAKRK